MRLLCINCTPDLTYFEQRGLHFDIEYQTSNEIFPYQYIGPVKESNGDIVDLYTPNPIDYLNSINLGDNLLVLVGWYPKDYPDTAKNTGGYTYPIPLKNGSWCATIRLDTPPINMYPVHELHHLLCFLINVVIGDHTPKDFMDLTPVNGQWFPYYENDPNITDPNSNFNQTWRNIVPFLPQLKTLTIMPTYKYFKPNEIIGLQPSLVQVLDISRGIAGTPFIITSGFRTPTQNTSVGGEPNSSHLRGLAADIACIDNIKRTMIIKGLLNCGTPVFLEIAQSHIHVDVDNSVHNLGQTISNKDD